MEIGGNAPGWRTGARRCVGQNDVFFTTCGGHSPQQMEARGREKQPRAGCRHRWHSLFKKILVAFFRVCNFSLMRGALPVPEGLSSNETQSFPTPEYERALPVGRATKDEERGSNVGVIYDRDPKEASPNTKPNTGHQAHTTVSISIVVCSLSLSTNRNLQ